MSTQYGVRDAACPLSTRGGGGGGDSARLLQRGRAVEGVGPLTAHPETLWEGREWGERRKGMGGGGAHTLACTL